MVKAADKWKDLVGSIPKVGFFPHACPTFLFIF